jgi:hypothetical protein
MSNPHTAVSAGLLASSDYKRVRIRFPSSLKECLFYLTDCNAYRVIDTDHLLEIGDAPIRLLPFGGMDFLTQIELNRQIRISGLDRMND